MADEDAFAAGTCTTQHPHGSTIESKPYEKSNNLPTHRPLLQRVWLAWRWLLLAEADCEGGDVDAAPLLLILDQVTAAVTAL
jgi:hypothetical protein